MEIMHKSEVLIAETAGDNNTELKIEGQQDNLAIFINNIIGYCRITSTNSLKSDQAKQLQEVDRYSPLLPQIKLQEVLREQLNELWFDQQLKKLSDTYPILKQAHQLQTYEQKLYDMEKVIRQLLDCKNNASSEEKYISFESQINKYIQNIEEVINSIDIRNALDQYDPLKESLQKSSEGSVPSQIDVPSSHYFKQLINTKIDYSRLVFSFIKPEGHQYYITEAARSYHNITSFKIKHIALSVSDGPVINRSSYFGEEVDVSKAILCYCLPDTNKLAYYTIADLVGRHTVGKEFYQQRGLANQWTFSKATKSVITPTGKIFAVNCRTTSLKIDPYFYEVTDVKASNRGPLMAAKRDSSLLYLNGYIYLLGGRGDNEKCSKKGYRYSIKNKKWSQICDSNVGLRSPTLCSVNNRYICKIGGLNEFDYINRTIEMYDSVTDRWSLVRASPKNILEQIQILQDSLALQINDDQIYVFGGKNSNKFNSDSGFVLVISEIHERRKGPAKVVGELWNVSVGKRNILSYFGQFGASSAIIQHNCIYGLRNDVSKFVY